MNPECEWCDQVATCEVHAQWTLADFDYVTACDVHWGIAVDFLDNRFVEGRRPVWLYTRRYDVQLTLP